MANYLKLVETNLSRDVFESLKSPDKSCREEAWEKALPVLQTIVFGILNQKWDTHVDNINELRDKIIFKFYEHIETFTYHGSHALIKWIIFTTNNALKNVYRSNSRNPRISLELLDLDFTHLHAEDPEDEFLELEDDSSRRALEAMYNALKQLTVREKEVFDLYYTEKLISREIADRLGKSDTSVKALLHRAKEKIRKYVNEAMSVTTSATR